MNKFVRVVIAVVLVIVLVGAVAFWAMSRKGENQLEAWIGGQLKEIVNKRINPVLEFDSLDYQSPGTVIVKNFRLTADSDQGKIDIVRADEATIKLAEIPRVGKPLVVEEVHLIQPTVRVIAHVDNPTDFVGFSNLVKRDPTSQPTTDQSGKKVSDVLNIRVIEIVNGAIEYDPKMDNTEPMKLEDINAKLNVTPDAAGLYRLNGEIARAPIFSLAADGKFDMDRAIVEDMQIDLSLQLDDKTMSSLPPQLQQLITRYEIRGALKIGLTGSIPLNDPMSGELRSEVKLDHASATFGDWTVPIDSAILHVSLDDRVVRLNNSEITAFDGFTKIVGEIALNEMYDAKLSIDARKINLARLMSSRASTQPTSLLGFVDAQVALNAPSKIVIAKIMDNPEKERDPLVDASLPVEWGKGRIELRNGRLVRVPLVSKFNDLIIELTRYVSLNRDSKPVANESASIIFTLSENDVRFSKLDYSGSMVAARGTGTIGLNQSLNLRFNGGPIEKLQEKLGVVGDLLGTITDNVGSYRVTGTLSDPKGSVGLLQ
ncbi:MAG TPA: hypothetical protein PK402_09060 [Tepidisphaeraceae bacterium]|nr:hypothetical protein [Tepidisphaeraceae bacterium]